MGGAGTDDERARDFSFRRYGTCGTDSQGRRFWHAVCLRERGRRDDNNREVIGAGTEEGEDGRPSEPEWRRPGSWAQRLKDPFLAEDLQALAKGALVTGALFCDGLVVPFEKAALCLEAASGLALDSAVVHFHTVKPLDVDAVAAAAACAICIVTVEEGIVSGGLGTAVLETVSGLTKRPPVCRLGLPDAFPDTYGTRAEMLEHYGLTAERIAGLAAAQVATLLPPSGAPGQQRQSLELIL